eukprot:g27689.t1
MAEVLSLQLEDDQSGAEEAMMQDFVRLHMMSMLQPFAERVQALHGELSRLADAQHQSYGLLKHLEGCSSMQGDQLQSASEEIQRHKEQLELQQAELSTERNRLEGNHEITKASLAKARETLEEMQSLVEAQGEQQKQSRWAVPPELRPQLIFPPLPGWRQWELEDTLARVAALSSHPTQIVTSNQLLVSVDSLKEQLESNSRGFHARTEELQQELLGLKERWNPLRLSWAQMSFDPLPMKCKAWADTDREVLHLKTWTEELKQLQELTDAQAESQAQLKAQQQRLSQLELRVSEIILRPDHEGSALREELEAVQQRLEQAMTEVLKGKDQQKLGIKRAQVDLLSSASHRITDLEAEVPRLQEQLGADHASLEDDANHLELGAWKEENSQQLLGAQRSLRRAEAQLVELQGRVQEVGHGQEEPSRRARDSRAEPELRMGRETRAVETLRGSERTAIGTSRSQELRQEQGSTRESLTKMSARLDLCNKYFSGLGKGLKEAHHQIVGGDGVLPKMGEHGALPPLMPRTPRTPRTCGVADALQMAASFNCGQTALWICSLGGAVVGHLASNDTVPFQGRVHQAQENTGDEPSSDGPNGLLFRIVRFGSIGASVCSATPSLLSLGRRERSRSKSMFFRENQKDEKQKAFQDEITNVTVETRHQWQEPRDSDSDSEDDSFCRGLDHEVIEGHTIGHTFHSTSTGRREAGNVEHLKCMVCMEEFVEGDTLPGAPLLCHEQPANTAATGNGLTRMLRWR